MDNCLICDSPCEVQEYCRHHYFKKWYEGKGRLNNTRRIRAYRATTKGHEATLKSNKNYQCKHPERVKAWQAVNSQHAKLPHLPCIKCGSKKTHLHHPNPLEPLKVIALCALHHSQEHRTMSDTI